MESSVGTISLEEVKALITQLLVEDLDIEPDLVTDSATLEELDLDSLDLVEIGQVVDQKFGVRIRGSDAEGVTNIGDVVRMIHDKATAGPEAAESDAEEK